MGVAENDTYVLGQGQKVKLINNFLSVGIDKKSDRHNSQGETYLKTTNTKYHSKIH